MKNKKVINNLKKIIEELDNRIIEINGLNNDPSVPLNQRPIRRNQIIQRVSSINLRILHLEQILHDRELIHESSDSVPPLSNLRKTKLKAALTIISQDVSTMKTFKAAIRLSAQISRAASKAALNADV